MVTVVTTRKPKDLKNCIATLGMEVKLKQICIFENLIRARLKTLQARHSMSATRIYLDKVMA